MSLLLLRAFWFVALLVCCLVPTAQSILAHQEQLAEFVQRFQRQTCPLSVHNLVLASDLAGRVQFVYKTRNITKHDSLTGRSAQFVQLCVTFSAIHPFDEPEVNEQVDSLILVEYGERYFTGERQVSRALFVSPGPKSSVGKQACVQLKMGLLSKSIMFRTGDKKATMLNSQCFQAVSSSTLRHGHVEF
jgi:hypothetical protein